MQLHLEHVRLEAFAFAFCAAHIKIAQELHLDLFVTCARATFATSVTGVKRKGACGQALRHRLRLRGEQFADLIKQTKIKNRSGTRGTGERRLIYHHHVSDSVRACDRSACTWFLV